MTIRFVFSLLLVFVLSWWIGARLLQQPGTPEAVAARSASASNSSRQLPAQAMSETSTRATSSIAHQTSTPNVAASSANHADVDQAPAEVDAFPSLPPSDALVAEQLDAMRARAEQGDAKAACWLGLELTRCHELRRMPPWSDSSMSELSKAPADHQDKGARLSPTQQFEAFQQRCQGLSPAQTRGAGSWLLDAADAGSVPAIERLLLAGPSASTEFPDAILLERLLNRQLDYLVFAARRGSMVAMEQLQRGVSGVGEFGLESTFATISALDRAYVQAYIDALEAEHAAANPEPRSANQSYARQSEAETKPTLPAATRAQIRAQAAHDYRMTWQHQSVQRDDAVMTEAASDLCRQVGPRPPSVTSLREVFLP